MADIVDTTVTSKSQFEGQGDLDTTFSCGLQACLAQRWTRNDFSDFTVIVEGEEFSCHKFIMASCSRFFSLLLSNDMKENLTGRVTLKGIRKRTFVTILNAIYRGVRKLTSDNIIEIWHAVHMLDIPYLIQECELFIVSNLNVKNYLQFYHHGRQLHSQIVCDSINTFILNHFEHYRNTAAFLCLSIEDVLELVRNRHLKVDSENSVIEAILAWTNFDIFSMTEDNKMEQILLNESKEIQTDLDGVCAQFENDLRWVYSLGSKTIKEERKPQICVLLSSARLCCCSEKCLENLLVHPMVTSDVSAIAMVKNALLHRWRLNGKTSLVQYRKCHGLCNAVAFVSDNKLVCFDLEEKKLYELSLSRAHYCGAHLAASNSVLFISVVNRRYRSIEYLRESFDQPSIIAKTLDCNTLLLCHLNNVIIVTDKQDICENLHQVPNSPYGTLTFITQYCPKHAFIYKEFIFVFSWPMYTFCCTKVEVFSLDRKTSFLLKELPYVSEFSSFYSNDDLYVLDQHGALWQLTYNHQHSPAFDLIQLTTLWCFRWNLCGAVCYSGVLYLFGNYVNLEDSIASCSVHGVFQKIVVVTRDYDTRSVTMVIPRDRLHSVDIIDDQSSKC